MAALPPRSADPPLPRQETYKLPHRLIEKKRRDRINECIAQLKDLLPEHLKLTVRTAARALPLVSVGIRGGFVGCFFPSPPPAFFFSLLPLVPPAPWRAREHIPNFPGSGVPEWLGEMRDSTPSAPPSRVPLG